MQVLSVLSYMWFHLIFMSDLWDRQAGINIYMHRWRASGGQHITPKRQQPKWHRQKLSPHLLISNAGLFPLCFCILYHFWYPAMAEILTFACQATSMPPSVVFFLIYNSFISKGIHSNGGTEVQSMGFRTWVQIQIPSSAGCVNNPL